MKRIEITRGRFPGQENWVSTIECPDDFDIAGFVFQVGQEKSVTRVRVLDAEPERAAESAASAPPYAPWHEVELTFDRGRNADQLITDMRAMHSWDYTTSTADRQLGGALVKLAGPGTPEALELLTAWTTLLRLRGLLVEDAG